MGVFRMETAPEMTLEFIFFGFLHYFIQIWGFKSLEWKKLISQDNSIPSDVLPVKRRRCLLKEGAGNDAANGIFCFQSNNWANKHSLRGRGLTEFGSCLWSDLGMFNGRSGYKTAPEMAPECHFKIFCTTWYKFVFFFLWCFFPHQWATSSSSHVVTSMSYMSYLGFFLASRDFS